jgi:hypothetical protein
LEERQNKFSPTSRKGFLAGFDEFNQNYLVFDYNTHCFVNTYDANFDENFFPEQGNEVEEIFQVEPKTKNTLPTSQVIPPANDDSKYESAESEESQPNPSPNHQQNPTIIEVIPPKPPINHPEHPEYVQ